MGKLALTQAEPQDHEKIVDQLNQEYADSITPEYIAKQHTRQSQCLDKRVQIKVAAKTRDDQQ